MNKSKLSTLIAITIILSAATFSACSNNENQVINKNKLENVQQTTPEAGEESEKNSSDGDASLKSGYETMIFPHSSESYIKESNLEGLSYWELQVARNEIFARRGYRFNQKDFKDYFTEQSWYKPDDHFSYDNMNEYELYNVELISKYEKTKEADNDSSNIEKTSEDEGSNEKALNETDSKDTNTVKNPEEIPGTYPGGSYEYLTKNQLIVFSSFAQIQTTKNEIFARLGYDFQQKKFKNYFSKCDWYSPRDDFSYDKLNKFEVYNVDLLNEVESSLLNTSTVEYEDGAYTVEFICSKDKELTFRIVNDPNDGYVEYEFVPYGDAAKLPLHEDFIFKCITDEYKESIDNYNITKDITPEEFNLVLNDFMSSLYVKREDQHINIYIRENKIVKVHL